jgi:hypothetical protein
VGDAILFDGLLEFAESVLASLPLANTYGAYARKYVSPRPDPPV